MKHAHFLFACLLLSSCPAPTTAIRLRLQYEDAWPLSSFVVSARDKMVRLNSASSDGTKTREIVVSIANDWAGEPIVYTVRAYVGAPGREELYASGYTTVTAIEGEVVDDVILFARSACATWCTPGATFCRNGGVMVCETSETGCPRWGAPSLCSDAQSCSLGECGSECVNECAEGETRCSGPLGVEICGQSDDDACLDWQQPILCEGAQICSNGRCGDSCTSECTPGSVRCRDGGVSSCADSNSDGCFEWGPSVSCAAGESCTGNEGLPNTAGVAHCQARSTCMDSCTANACANNTFTSCGHFNLDSCLEPSAGTNCASANPCEEGICDLAANGGMGGCVTRPRNTPECIGQCAGQAENSPCNDNEACTTGDSCQSGLCTGTPMNCTAGREPTCEGGVARTYAMTGMCMNGICQYSMASEETCSQGCDGNHCAADPCEGVSCPALPSVPARNQVCYVRNSGMCSGGTCSFQFTTNSCDDGNACTVSDLCSSGICAGTPMNCTAGRESTCENGVARTYAMVGMCVSGSCQYSVASEETCANGCDGTRCAAVVVEAVPQRIATGRVHSCALLRDGTMRCWGYGAYGQLGDNNSSSRSTPVAVVGLSTVTSIAAGSDHTCALLQDGTVRCWGDNGNGQLGTNDYRERSAPTTVAGLSHVAAITAGGDHTCALQNGTVHCWGRGHLGNGRTESPTPVAVSGLSNVSDITTGNLSVFANGSHTCALLQNGTVRCWGPNEYGQLGNGGTTAENTPVPVAGLSSVAAIAAGAYHTCARLQDGTVRCWGRGHEGELGNGGTENESMPVRVMGLSNVVAISAGDGFSCALLQDGTVRCWGASSYGVLGNGSSGSTNFQSTPVIVTNLSNVAAISAGEEHVCALLRDDSARCWGNGERGQLGNNRTGNGQDYYFETTPVTVLGLP